MPSNAFDCVILTQTLHLIFDVAGGSADGAPDSQAGRGGARHGAGHQPDPRRSLAGDLVLVIYASGSSGDCSPASFSPAEIQIDATGNVFAACAFLQGLAQEELTAAELDATIRCIRSSLTARARKPRLVMSSAPRHPRPR